MRSVQLCECVVIYFYLLPYASICFFCFLLPSIPIDKSQHTSLILAFLFNVHQSGGKKHRNVLCKITPCSAPWALPRKRYVSVPGEEQDWRHLCEVDKSCLGGGVQGTAASSVFLATVTKHPRASSRLVKLWSPISTGR